MEIRVNGEIREEECPVTIRELLGELGVRPETVVVERNLRIVPRERFGDETIAEGDSLEIIRMVGGG